VVRKRRDAKFHLTNSEEGVRMIDIENVIFNRVATKVRDEYPDIYMTGEYVKSPSSFPAVSLVEMDNATRTDTIDSGSNENHANVMYEVNVYSNKATGKKSECKDIIALIDKEMLTLGFARNTLTPVPNMNDSTIYRMVGRYRATVSTKHEIIRR
jgi:hypothetical protein